MGVILYPWRFETVHDHLAPSFVSLVVFPGEEIVHDAEEAREALFGRHSAGQMWVILHELIGMELDAVFVFVLEEQAVIEVFCPFIAKEPVTVMPLPGDVEGSAVTHDRISRTISHA